MNARLTDNELVVLYNGQNDDINIPERDDHHESSKFRLDIEQFVKEVKEAARQRPSVQREFVIPKPKSAISLNDKHAEKDRDYEMMELKVHALKQDV